MGVSYGEKLTFVGDAKNPIWIGKRKEMADLLSKEFFEVYDLWRRHKAGFGLPVNPYDMRPDFFDILTDFSLYYDREFSHGSVLLKYAGSIIEHQRVLIKSLGRRR